MTAFNVHEAIADINDIERAVVQRTGLGLLALYEMRDKLCDHIAEDADDQEMVALDETRPPKLRIVKA